MAWRNMIRIVPGHQGLRYVESHEHPCHLVKDLIIVMLMMMMNLIMMMMIEYRNFSFIMCFTLKFKWPNVQLLNYIRHLYLYSMQLWIKKPATCPASHSNTRKMPSIWTWDHRMLKLLLSSLLSSSSFSSFVTGSYEWNFCSCI